MKLSQKAKEFIPDDPQIIKEYQARIQELEFQEQQNYIQEENQQYQFLDNNLAPPFDENGNKTGQWLEGTYEFGEWYYDLSGNPVFISPSDESDIIGDLYDQDSELYMNYMSDQFGNLLPLILVTQDYKYFEFIPSMYYKFVYDSMENYLLQANNKQQKKEKQKKTQLPNKEPPPPRVPKRLLVKKDENQQQINSSNDYKHEKILTLEEAVDIEKKSYKQKSDYHIVDRERGSLNIVFIGHVDHGKSTLSGRILKNCGEVDDNELRKYELEAKENCRESWFLAYIMDTNDEERTKGITVECGKAHFQLANRRFVLIDAPGHKNYVPNMIAGACQADVAALVISARQGEFEAGFEGGQTQEHAHLAKALGVQHVICIVTKMDEVDWNKQRYEQIKENMEIFLKQDIGFQSIEWVPVNGFQNENIDQRVKEERCSWYQGPTLFELLNQCPVPQRNANGPVRIPVLDRYKEQGYYIFGKIESGTIKEDMWMTVMPNKQQIQIQAIYNTKDQRVFYASAGENIKIKIKSGEDRDIERGFVLCSTDDLCMVTQCFIAEVQILKLPNHKPIFSQGYKCVLHIHTCVLEIEIEQVEAVMNSENKKLTRTSFLKSEQIGVAKISIIKSQNLCVEKFEKISNMGRFTLRDEEKTIGFGKVMKIKPIQL